MALHPTSKAPFDEDEDLFHFDELYNDKDEQPGEELDLDEFLKAFADTPPPSAAGDEPAIAPAPPPDVAPPPVAATVTAPAPGPVALHPRFSRAAWTVVLCLLGGQFLASVLVWLGGARTRAEFGRERQVLELTTEELRAEFERRTAEIEELTRPIVTPDPLHTGEAFARIERDLGAGRFAEARRALYALLAIVDRLEEPARVDTEARARFLLADVLRLESERRAATP